MLKLHHAPNSRAGRIVWILEELEIKYKINSMKFHPSVLKSDEHRKRHPLGRVPVVEDGNIIIYESGAIIEYIITKHANGRLKPPVESPLYPLYLQWFHYCEGMIMPPINTIVVQTILLPKERRYEEALNQAPIGETANFAWNATPLGIAAIYKGISPSKPPYEQAIKEGEELSMDLSREEKEFHLTQKGLALIFYS